MSNTLHFTLSPVQGFVSQARRTRDLWAGSYLLSYLIANAMKTLGKDNITFPDVSQDALLGRLLKEENINKDLAMRLGSIPNRFTATLNNHTGDDCKMAIQQAWINIADKVREQVDPNKPLFTDIWDRQINGLWDQQWVIGEESYLLDQRKNLRNHYPDIEGGEKCTVCGERQELSGEKKALPTKINQWWSDNIRGKVHDLDIRDGERLCAVCLTKRLFPTTNIAKKAIGWEVPKFYPSTAYLSAIDWLTDLFKLLNDDDNSDVKYSAEQKKAIVDAANNFLKIAKEVLPYKLVVAERRTFIQGIIEGIKTTGINEEFAILDGDIFYLSSIQLETYTLKGDTQKEQSKNRKKLIKALKQLSNAIKIVKPALKEPSPFYAILFMDGDGMGKLLGGCNATDKQKVSQALANFTQQVPDIIKSHNGILTYAGGDDVFALLPVSSALDCASICREAYLSSFAQLVSDKIIAKADATISAAIEYTHMNTALGVVVKDSHHLLDDIAKDKTGRDAIACRVWKRGGPVLTWSQPWATISNGKLIKQIQSAFHTADKNKFSSKFFYKLRDLFDLIQAEGNTTHLSEQEIKDLLVMEYLANRQHDINSKLSKEEHRKIAEERIEKILQLCREQIRHVDEISKQETIQPEKYKADGAMLIRFLSQKEV